MDVDGLEGRRDDGVVVVVVCVDVPRWMWTGWRVDVTVELLLSLCVWMSPGGCGRVGGST